MHPQCTASLLLCSFIPALWLIAITLLRACSFDFVGSYAHSTEITLGRAVPLGNLLGDLACYMV